MVFEDLLGDFPRGGVRLRASPCDDLRGLGRRLVTRLWGRAFLLGLGDGEGLGGRRGGLRESGGLGRALLGEGLGWCRLGGLREAGGLERRLGGDD